MAGGVHEADGALELSLLTTAHTLGGGAVALRLGTIGTLVDGEVGVAELNRDTPLELLAVLGGPLTSDGLDKRRLAMVDVTNGAEVYFGLLW